MIRRRFPWVLAAVAALLGAAGAPAQVQRPTKYWSSLVQDGSVTGQYTFISILNTDINDRVVTLSFFARGGGDPVKTVEDRLRFGQQWRVFTGSAGSPQEDPDAGDLVLAATKGLDGYATVTADVGDRLKCIDVWLAVVIPGDIGLPEKLRPGFTGKWGKSGDLAQKKLPRCDES